MAVAGPLANLALLVLLLPAAGLKLGDLLIMVNVSLLLGNLVLAEGLVDEGAIETDGAQLVRLFREFRQTRAR